MARWRRQRMFMPLLAEEASTGRLLGCALVSMMAADTILPPPFPEQSLCACTSATWRVKADARRQGVATALLTACERLGTDGVPLCHVA